MAKRTLREFLSPSIKPSACWSTVTKSKTCFKIIIIASGDLVLDVNLNLLFHMGEYFDIQRIREAANVLGNGLGLQLLKQLVAVAGMLLLEEVLQNAQFLVFDVFPDVRN